MQMQFCEFYYPMKTFIKDKYGETNNANKETKLMYLSIDDMLYKTCFNK